jgi:hypothetical protein
MKLIICFVRRLLLLVVAVVSGFAVLPSQKLAITSQAMGWFDQAFHGSGSASKDELDEMFRTQQEILAARRGETKEHFKKKYKEPRQFETKATNLMPTAGTAREDMFYVSVDSKPAKRVEVKKAKSIPGAFKMPWDK